MSEYKPWLLEPVHLSFEHAGLPCVLNRWSTESHWCGYVGIPKGHPLHGFHYAQSSPALAAALERRKGSPLGLDAPWIPMMIVGLGGGLTASPELALQVHGGVTFADNRAPGESASDWPGYWWFGFDCGHLNDLSPDLLVKGVPIFEHQTWRTVDYVRTQAEQLAEQLAAVEVTS